ncbi:hypothetical protein SEVIR_3G411044v4 [Setaria viridis]
MNLFFTTFYFFLPPRPAARRPPSGYLSLDVRHRRRLRAVPHPGRQGLRRLLPPQQRPGADPVLRLRRSVIDQLIEQRFLSILHACVLVMDDVYREQLNDLWASVPNMNLDQVFEQKNDVARAVEEELAKAMDTYGYEIGQTLVVEGGRKKLM